MANVGLTNSFIGLMWGEFNNHDLCRHDLQTFQIQNTTKKPHQKIHDKSQLKILIIALIVVLKRLICSPSDHQSKLG